MTTPSNRYVAHAASGRIRLVVVLIVLAIAAVIAVGGYFLAKGTAPAQTGGGRFGRGGPGGSGVGGGAAMPVGAAEVVSGDLKEGDQIEIRIARERVFEVRRDQSKPHALARLRKLRRPLPPGFVFDREEANAR